MASDNMAVDVIDVDAMSVHEMEAGLGSSRMQLLQMEEQRPPSIRESIKKSVTKSVRKAKYYLSFIFAPFKYILLKFKLLILIALYSCFGAWLFRTLEVPHDLAVKEEAYHARLIARDVMILNLRAIHLENREDRENRWKETVMQFEADVGLDEPSLDTAWTFWMAFLYAGTLYTTIGYGNIACQTRGGQVATIIYAFVGIPITLVLLNAIGDFLLKLTRNIAALSSDILLFSGVRWGFIPLEEGSEKRKRYQYFCYKLSKYKIIPATSQLSIVLETKNEDVKHDPPVLSAIIFTIFVMFASAGLFSLLEGWDFFISWYFFFISCSTIGLGDVVPSKPEFMIIAMGVMLVGLAMITVCFNVIQDKMEQLYMELLNKLLEDYLKAVENNDPNATAGMMAGFQGKAKFLIPLMSKNTGATAMDKFKKECAEKGIEPPPVLTNINPDTGIPAFATANKEDFSEFIEQADEKQAEERRLVEERVQSRQSNQPEVRVSTVPVIDVCVQAEMAPLFAPRPPETTFGTQTFSAPDRSFAAQFSPPAADMESQTEEAGNVDEGIQTWPSYEEVSVQYDAISVASCSVQYEYPELTTSTAAGEEPPEFTCTGIQPEVSMFAVSDDSDIETTDVDMSGEEEEDTLEENLHNLTLPTIQRLRKSVSEESQDTVVSVSPSMSPTSRRKKLDEKKNKKKKKMRTEGLRFMKHSGDQTSLEVFSMECQTDYRASVTGVQCQAETSEQALQFTAERKGRRCQTRITCIPVEKQNLGLPLHPPPARTPRRLLTQPSNVSATSDQIHSVASFEALARHPSLQSIDESLRSDLEAGDSEAGAVANLDVSFVSKPVDEEGVAVMEVRGAFYVDEPSIAESAVTGASIGDDIFDSEDDFLDDEDMELFVLNECTQTDDLLHFDDIETQASVADFDILKEVLCQTELSSFRFPQKSLEEQKKSVELTSTDISEEASAALLELSEAAVETRGLMESAVQTTQTMVYVGEREEQEAEREPQGEPGVQYLVDSGCNPDYEGVETSCQTETPQTSTPINTAPQTVEAGEQTDVKEETEVAVQAGFELLDADTQVVLSVEERDVQATVDAVEGQSQVELELQEAFVQVEESLWRREEQTSVQTAAECSDSATETVLETAEAEAQTVFRQSSTGIQPLDELARPRGVQTFVNCQQAETQMDVLGMEVEAQTEEEEPVPTCETETQTDPKKVKRKETSVSTTSATKSSATEAVKEYAPTGVDATIPVKSTQAQSDVSMFIVDPSDRSRMEVEYGVRFNVDNGTWMEEKRLKHIGTQRDASAHNSAVQAYPAVVTSHTQYVSCCASDQHSQTEIMTKNKRSQEVDASTSLSCTAMVTEEEEPEAAPAAPGILWSDFDPVVEEWDDETSQASAHSKTSREGRSSVKTEQDVETAVQDLAQQMGVVSEQLRALEKATSSGVGGGGGDQPAGSSPTETPTSSGQSQELPPAVKHDASCSAAPETDEMETQATVEMETKGSGFEGQDDWVKVYVQELDEERRNRMFDIGIQTGVLARVQHMYGKKDVATEEGSNVDILKVSLRKTDSQEALAKSKRHDGSEESLSHASSVRSIAESIDDNPTTWPSTSSAKPAKTEVKRSASVKKPAKKKEAVRGDVADTIRRFERRNQPEQRRARSSSSER